MTDFSDLRKAYGAYSAARDEHWDELERQSVELFDGFVEYLSPEPKVFRASDGSLTPYIDIGRESIHGFESLKRAGELDSRGVGLEFAIRVTLDEDPDSLYKQFFIFKITLQKSEGKYLVRLGGDASGRNIKAPTSPGLGGQPDLFEAMAAEIVQFLNPDKFK